MELLVLLLISLISIANACVPVKTPSPGIPACKTCVSDKNFITPTGNDGALPMNDDTTVSTGACSVRTFRCDQQFAAIYAYDDQNHIIKRAESNGPGTIMYSLTCTAAGKWVTDDDGSVVARVSCLNIL